MNGAHVRARTGDLVLTKDVLCQLSYVGARRFCRNLEMTGNHQPILANLGIGSFQTPMVVGREGIEPPQSKTADLQSAELTTCSTYPRLRSAGGALPTEREYSERSSAASSQLS